MPVIDNRMGISTVVALLDLWLDRKFELLPEEYDWLCARVVDFLGESRDEVWRLRRLESEGDRDTDPDMNGVSE